MSKPPFRLNLTAAHAKLLEELLSKCAVGAQDAAELGSLYAQVVQARKHYGLVGYEPPAQQSAPPPNGK